MAWNLNKNGGRHRQPKGIAGKAKKLVNECKDALPWLVEVERRFAEILQRASFRDEDEPEALKENFEQRIEDIKGALENCIDNVGCALENWRNETDREEKRVAAHGLAAEVESTEEDAGKARADLASLIKWSDELLKQLADAPPPKRPVEALSQDLPSADGRPTEPIEARKKPVKESLKL